LAGSREKGNYEAVRVIPIRQIVML